MVEGFDDEAGDVVGFEGDDEVVEEGGEGDFGEGHLGDDALHGGGCGEARKFVSGTCGRGLREQRAEIFEGVDDASLGEAVRHRWDCSVWLGEC